MPRLINDNVIFDGGIFDKTSDSDLEKEPLLLAIESSCDDTSAAVLRGKQVLSNIVSNQEVHKAYGGVVPELASRAHQKNIIPTVNKALKDADVEKSELDAITVTAGPGLMGSLLVGTSFAKSLALGLGIPLITVNHMEAHIMAHFIGDNSPALPMLCLTVSGGHTQIVRVDAPLKFEVLGETIDDAAGEAFDKCAKLLGLPYPGGPLIDKLAREGDSGRFSFPESKLEGYEFSFSGLKTSVLYFLQKQLEADGDFIEKNLNDLCASIQGTIVGTLMKKFLQASRELGISTLAVAGGVSANSALRSAILDQENKGYECHIPAFQYCTDNAAMIGIVGYYKFLERDFTSLEVVPKARMKI